MCSENKWMPEHSQVLILINNIVVSVLAVKARGPEFKSLHHGRKPQVSVTWALWRSLEFARWPAHPKRWAPGSMRDYLKEMMGRVIEKDTPNLHLTST